MILEYGKIYIVKSSFCGAIWLFKKHGGAYRDRKTGCLGAICLDDMYITEDEGYVCNDSEVLDIKPANKNYIAIWNKKFNDNVELL